MAFLKVIVLWFIFQMIIIGCIQVTIDRQVEEKTYQCSKYHGSNFNYYLVVALFPIATFIQEYPSWEEYCKNNITP